MGDFFIISSGGRTLTNPLFASGVKLIDRYVVNSFHAAGGMQEVYLCFDNTLDRHVVVKTPKNGVKDRRFRRGAEMGARVNHANIAATFDYYEDEKLTFLVEEYVPGLDLGRRLDHDFTFLDPSLAAHVTHQIARALLAAHRVGICHRDLKPSNVMVSNDASLSVIKLTDFGIAKLAENEIEAEMEAFDKDASTLVNSNTLLGAVPYMAPECWDDWKAAGQPTDVWALGCIAYHLLAGDPPFGQGRMAIMNVAKLVQGGPLLVKPKWFGKHKSVEILEDGLWEIINSCIQVDPNLRPSAADVVKACDNLCYAVSTRRTGTVKNFKVSYPGGGKGSFGFIVDSASFDEWFFHDSEFFGTGAPVQGMRVNFSTYPGTPSPRSSPVLQIK